ncbi:Stk1 family PASTA domain-containing Ser/Thr kinase [Clostridioides difficile]|uniref:PASTA domain-containing Ser/Thr kinase PrkC n=1 Tax=Clostridioides sp. GD02404 TaxID=3054354 RepID=UPI0006BBAF75|nr:serine/threonine protein kinase [Clostridioides difficile]MCI9975053.1 PASTA domain-containing Ser/Thr kinase PrkC [Clostridioides difficile]MDB3085273.1 Stk1 family PASTA domain-containing Ser/Thr kinase [Clostridioides difficile]MDI0266738.1 PASTA domain-containing Ser/Thr kinase PrkC [Clostridioides difficile]MDI7816826.1 PASTA domain-containing Ser/Thr kinase PrkC [Clostridioides difficile]
MGDTILGNRYEIIRKIGDGGMAFVYEAKDRLLNRTVALKVLRPEFVDDDEFLTKFKREAEAVASLSHPNIVNVYDVGEDGKVHYIVMEFVDGKNLKEIIQDEGTLDEYTALDITKQIAMALSAAHKKGIIHRDIKPHNILISNEGRVVKVADFGIAKAVSNSTMTNIGSIIGSVHYFSPEQAKGKFVTNNADLYSLGIVLYEMLIGKVPFRGDSPISIALQHINDDIDFTSEEKVRIPQSVRTTIKKLTEKSSADRYQSAEELIEDIEYIEKNIDLDFIKEYDDFATKKIDEKEINKVVNPILAKPAPEKVVKPVEVADLDEDDDYYDDFYEDDDDEDEDEEEIMRAKKNQKPKNTPSKRAKKKKKKQESPKSRKRLKVIAAILIVILCAQVFLAYKFLFAGGFGNKSLSVPNLVNMTLEEAQSTVEKEGLSLSVKSEEYSSEVDENCIISQTPEGGSTNVKKGDTINVVVSKGANQASVPNVVGLTLSNAKQLIEENNLKVGTVKYEYSSIYKEGTVLNQSPGASSSRAQEGDEINLYVSKGSEKSNTQTPTTPDKTPTTPDDDTKTPGSNSGNNGSNSGGSNSGNSGGNSGNNGSNSGGSNSGNSGGNSGNNGSNSGDNGDNSGGSNSGGNGDNSGGSNSGNSGDNSGGSSSGGNGETPSGTGGNIGKTE